MRVLVTKPVTKGKYQYKTVNLNETGFAGWELCSIGGTPPAEIDKRGNIFIGLRKEILE